MSIRERQNYVDKVKLRNAKIVELTGKPFTATANPTDPGLTTVEKARLSAERQLRDLSNQYPDIKNDDDLLKEIIEDSKRLREKSDSITSNSTFAWKVGSFTGTMAATMSDPLVLATIPFGASASAGILRTTLIEAGYGMLLEAMIQPFVYRYKKTLNSPYNVSDALLRIGAAGAGSAALGGTIKAGIRGYSRLTRPRLEGVDYILEAFEKHVLEPNSSQRDAAHVLGNYADVVQENPFDLGHPLVDEIHLQATAKAFADLDAGQPIDVRDIIRGALEVIPDSAMSEKEFNDFLYGVPDKLPRTIGGAVKQGVPTEDSIACLVR